MGWIDLDTEMAGSAPAAMTMGVVQVVQSTAFAAGPGGGNRCRVVLDAGGLDAAQLQGLAAAFGEEAAVVLPATDRAVADLRLRCFSPGGEMGMYVHATVATITVLVERGALVGPWC